MQWPNRGVETGCLSFWPTQPRGLFWIPGSPCSAPRSKLGKMVRCNLRHGVRNWRWEAESAVLLSFCPIYIYRIQGTQGTYSVFRNRLAPNGQSTEPTPFWSLIIQRLGFIQFQGLNEKYIADSI